MERKIEFALEEFYHLYNRGNNKLPIFNDKSDYMRFILLLYLSNHTDSEKVTTLFDQGLSVSDIFKKYSKNNDVLVNIGAYCLMPNHFHILVREIKGSGMSKMMQKLLTAYSMYFNRKNERTGGLFESRFKATHVDSDEYLKYLYSYIHLNPVKLIDPMWKENGIKDKIKSKGHLDSYPYSSYLDYRGTKREEGAILNISSFPEYFSKPADFDDFIGDWLSFKEFGALPRSDLGSRSDLGK